MTSIRVAPLMGISSYAELKAAILSFAELTKDAVHIYVGFFCLIAALVILRRPMTSYAALVPGLAVACVMEFLDLRLQFSAGRALRWAGSLHALVNTNLIPFLLVLFARRRWFKT